MAQAEAVYVFVVDPPTRGPAVSGSGRLLAQYLARHVVNVEMDELAMTLQHVSDVLMSRATDIDADMLVMGAYEHNRFRQNIFAGTTRKILEQARLPVLMAH